MSNEGDIRTILHQALRAYELAQATRLSAEHEAQNEHKVAIERLTAYHKINLASLNASQDASLATATVSVVLAAAEIGSAKGTPFLLPLEPGTLQPGVYTIAGLLFLGIVAGLFPDLDTPHTEL